MTIAVSGTNRPTRKRGRLGALAVGAPALALGLVLLSAPQIAFAASSNTH